ncbi:MAG TPA: hypothetical protein VK821_07425 [Dehalococcoidia bacterium]|nr:hypothetical protein [Dehalococcoidia bacterium]
MGHPFGILINFASILFNGIFDRYPGVRIGFMEAGAGWLPFAMERFSGSYASHIMDDPRGELRRLRRGEKVGDYIRRQIDEDRIYVGMEGDELTLAYAIKLVSNKPFIYSSDFPHEVSNEHLQGGDWGIAREWRPERSGQGSDLARER